MKGDFTRNTFDISKHFIRVLMQQGRVQLDADWNEQTSIYWHYLRTLVTHLIGPHGGPKGSFKITKMSEKGKIKIEDLIIGPGDYYVNGILCENEMIYDEKEKKVTYYNQPHYPLNKEENPLPEELPLLVYLDVWEHHITHVEDDSIREVALGGPDTATRAKIVWQVKTREINSGNAIGEIKPNWGKLVSEWQPDNRGKLKARAKQAAKPTDPCITSPDSSYRDTENQLYRVEIHCGGKGLDDKVTTEGKGNIKAGGKNQVATFKWSRDNGSVVFPILNISSIKDTTTVTLEHLGRDSRFSLQEGDWVEIVDDDYVLKGDPESLLKVGTVDRVNMQVTLDGITGSLVGKDEKKHPLLRRWDQKTTGNTELDNGAVRVQEGDWIVLEDGIQIYFKNDGSYYRTGDYWLIPARTATGDVEWPGTIESPELLPPHGVEHFYAPLAIIRSKEEEGKEIIGCVDCRKVFEPLAKPVK